MGTERKRKVSLFDVVDDGASKMLKPNGGVSINLINPWSLRPYSQRYFDILEKRKTLPVWHQKDEFLKALKENQTLILVGETGSGKTTQTHETEILRLRCANCLDHKPEWVIYNEFVRTVTDIKGEWLVDIAPHYYDLQNFPNCEAKRVLDKLYKKREREKDEARTCK
ncbi:hypothetical protein Lal_00004147 [Lupinus albus]|nr:hypothetical protein Lal_00004147 [Lupinus albus]